MVALPHRQRLILPIAPVAAGLVWVALAALFAGVSPETLDGWANASGLSSLLSVARPPLGFTARLVLILLGGGGAALAVWFGLSFAIGQRAVLIRPEAVRGVLLRRKDARPEAPHKLGTPVPDVTTPAKPEPKVEPKSDRDVPNDLDQPLAAFDPAAIPETPMAPVPSVAPLARAKPKAKAKSGAKPAKSAKLDRSVTVDITSMMRAAAQPSAEPIVAEHTRETITALLDRLEYGMAHREERLSKKASK